MTTTGSTAGRTTRLPSRAGGARFTGASASLKVVSGASALGTTDTNTAATNKNRTDIQRSRFTAHITPNVPSNYSGDSRLSMLLPGYKSRIWRGGKLYERPLRAGSNAAETFAIFFRISSLLSSCRGIAARVEAGSSRIRYFGFSVAGPETVVEWPKAA
jgi:hypothetical protein